MSALPHTDAGDDIHFDARLVIAPVAGVFQAVADEAILLGQVVTIGQVLGHIMGPGRSVEVTSFCDGRFMGMLAVPGQRLRVGQPVAWLRPQGPE